VKLKSAAPASSASRPAELLAGIFFGSPGKADHITAVANAFVIANIDLNDTVNFMGSSNIHEQAIKNGLWDPHSGKPFSFTEVYFARYYNVG
jgi:dipeptidase